MTTTTTTARSPALTANLTLEGPNQTAPASTYVQRFASQADAICWAVRRIRKLAQVLGVSPLAVDYDLRFSPLAQATIS